MRVERGFDFYNNKRLGTVPYISCIRNSWIGETACQKLDILQLFTRDDKTGALIILKLELTQLLVKPYQEHQTWFETAKAFEARTKGFKQSAHQKVD